MASNKQRKEQYQKELEELDDEIDIETRIMERYHNAGNMQRFTNSKSRRNELLQRHREIKQKLDSVSTKPPQLSSDDRQERKRGKLPGPTPSKRGKQETDEDEQTWKDVLKESTKSAGKIITKGAATAAGVAARTAANNILPGSGGIAQFIVSQAIDAVASSDWMAARQTERISNQIDENKDMPFGGQPDDCPNPTNFLPTEQDLETLHGTSTIDESKAVMGRESMSTKVEDLYSTINPEQTSGDSDPIQGRPSMEVATEAAKQPAQGTPFVAIGAEEMVEVVRKQIFDKDGNLKMQEIKARATQTLQAVKESGPITDMLEYINTFFNRRNAPKVYTSTDDTETQSYNQESHELISRDRTFSQQLKEHYDSKGQKSYFQQAKDYLLGTEEMDTNEITEQINLCLIEYATFANNVNSWVPHRDTRNQYFGGINTCYKELKKSHPRNPWLSSWVPVST